MARSPPFWTQPVVQACASHFSTSCKTRGCPGVQGSITFTNLGRDVCYPEDQAWDYDERTNVWLRYTMSATTRESTAILRPQFHLGH